MDWDRVRRERALGAHGGERAEVEHLRASVPASDKQVDQLVTLGYSGKRPRTSAEARLLIRELRDAKRATGQSSPLGDVENLVEQFVRLGDSAGLDAHGLR